MAISTEELLHGLRTRYATKAFDPAKKIEQATWDALEESLVLTPSSFGLQPWKFVVVETQETRQKLKAASWGQAQVTDASHMVVLTVRTDLTDVDIDRWISQLAKIQGKSVEDLAGLAGVIRSFAQPMTVEEKITWNCRQVYLALGQLMTSAAILGIDTCPLEGISPTDYDTILNLGGTGYRTAVGCAVGYRSADDKYADAPKARFPREELFSYV